MKTEGIRLDAALRVAIATHVRQSEQQEVLHDVAEERRTREVRAGTEAANAYARRVIASLTQEYNE